MNLAYLQYQFRYFGIGNVRMKSHRESRLSSWCVFEEGMTGGKEQICLVDVSFFKGDEEEVLTGFGGVVFWGFPVGRELLEMDGIYVDGEWSFTRVLNLMKEIFEGYERWEFSLLYSGDITLDMILEYSTPILHMPLTIINNEFRIMARNSLYAEIIPEDYLEGAEIDTVVWEKSFQSCTHKKGVFHFYSEPEKKELICFNILLSNRFYARMLGSVEQPEFEKVQEKLYGRLCVCVEKMFESQMAAPDRFVRSRDFYDAVGSLLDGEKADENILSQNGWTEEDTYQIVVLKFFGNYPVEEGSRYLYRQLLRIFPECCVLERALGYVCVRNLKIESQMDHDFREKLAVFLREHVVKAGLSNCFGGVRQFALYLEQAKDALKIGEKKDPDFWYYPFERYTFDYLLRQCTEKYPGEQVASVALKQLWDMDQEKGTDLYQTLDMYLRCGGNATQTAEKLYIHRSSLLKRLARIERMTHLQLEDSDVRLYLMLSYKLLDRG